MENVLTFEQFLEKLKDFKNNYTKSECKVDVKSIATLLMGGAMDSVFPSPPTLAQRHEYIKEVIKAAKSTSTLSAKKEGEISILDIDNELTRNVWLSKINPLHRFSLSSFYKSALKSMGFTEHNSPQVLFRHNEMDVIANFDMLFTDRVFDFYSNYNCRRTCAVVGIYKGKSEMTCKNGTKKMTVIINDGQSDMGVTVWSKRGSSEYDINITMKIKTKGSPVIIVGKPSKYGSKPQFTVSSILSLGF